MTAIVPIVRVGVVSATPGMRAYLAKGFAAESEDLLANARGKLVRKRLSQPLRVSRESTKLAASRFIGSASVTSIAVTVGRSSAASAATTRRSISPTPFILVSIGDAVSIS